MQRVRAQHSDYYISPKVAGQPRVYLGASNEEVVNDVRIMNYSNVDIQYKMVDGVKTVHYKNNDGKSLHGIIRIIVPAYDSAAVNEERKSGMQLIFDVADPEQFKKFIQINRELGGVPQTN